MGEANLKRTILHVDMDQFYAAVEIRDNPSLRGRPVVVGSDPKGGRGRGVVSTANYAARKFGVHSALPISQAYKRCPHAAFLPVCMDKYIAESRKIHQVFDSITPQVEPISLDEAFLDVTGSVLLFGDGPAIAEKIKADIFTSTALTASVGVAANKFVAKIASDHNKPNGTVVVPPGTEEMFLAPLSIRRMWGVGPKAEERLKRIGIETIAAAAAYPLKSLRAELGKYADDLQALARGQDSREVISGHEAKSVGRENTFSQDTNDLDQLRQVLAEISEDVAWRLRKHQKTAAQISLKIRFSGFETYTRQRPLKPASCHGPVFFKTGLEMAERLLKEKRKKVRLIGLSAGKICNEGSEAQQELFDLERAKTRDLDQAMDALNQRFGEDTVQRANQLGVKEPGFRRTGFSPDKK